jgi:hypothetical protein
MQIPKRHFCDAFVASLLLSVLLAERNDLHGGCVVAYASEHQSPYSAASFASHRDEVVASVFGRFDL